MCAKEACNQSKGLLNHQQQKKKANRHHKNAIKIAIKKCFGNFCEISLRLWYRAMKMLHAYKMDAVVYSLVVCVVFFFSSCSFSRLLWRCEFCSILLTYVCVSNCSMYVSVSVCVSRLMKRASNKKKKKQIALLEHTK